MLVVMERPVGKVWQVPRDSGQAVWYGISLVVSVWYGGGGTSIFFGSTKK